MSSCPGSYLEDYLMWNYDLIVNGDTGANPSLAIAEAMGTIKRRPALTSEQFAPLVALWEPWREYIERSLSYFNEEEQSWRDYAGYAFDDVPKTLFDEGLALLPPKQPVP